MIKNIFILSSLLVLILCCINENIKYKEISTIYHENMEKIINPDDKKITLSSNSNDYIEDNIESYEKILEYGDKMLEYILYLFKNNQIKGLESNIAAKICCDILGDSNTIIEWSTGEEWYNKYIDSLN